MTHATGFGYDTMGRRTTVTDALSHTTTTTYDARGRVTRITNHDGTHTDFAYDLGGRRTSVTDPLGRTTYYTYDGAGRLERVVDPLNGVTAYAYDAMSHLLSLTDAKGQTTAFEYDIFDRVDRVTYTGGGFETFTYDYAGRLFVTYAYDDDSKLTTLTKGTSNFTFGYDNAHRRTSMGYPNGIATGYTYDNAENRTSKAQLDYSEQYAYDPLYRLTGVDPTGSGSESSEAANESWIGTSARPARRRTSSTLSSSNRPMSTRRSYSTRLRVRTFESEFRELFGGHHECASVKRAFRWESFEVDSTSATE